MSAPPGDPQDTAAPDFGPRFALRGQRRGGGMGAIHVAWDRVRGERVALKTAHRHDPLTQSLLRNEFRALADIDHRNLVRLYELFLDGERLFFTMELIDGPPLLTWLRGQTGVSLATTADRGPEATLDPSDAPPPPAPTLPPPDAARLRAALTQLVEAVAALHRHGLVHRDVKPDNIRVDADDRLVLLDFGLVVRADGSAGEGGRGGWIAGTPGYMSPQQAAGRPPTPLDDWYGVGGVLCAALCGLRPDRGGRGALAELAHGPAPIAELAGLALALLHPDAARRLDGEGLARRLGLTPTASTARRLVGRAAELAHLRAAAARGRAGHAVVVHLWGPSGIGKSALVESFLADAFPRPADPPGASGAGGEDSGGLVLRGRSHRREDVPFGPFDALIDDLARQLTAWPRSAVDAVLPRHAGALARLFPVLDRLRAFDDAPGRDRRPADPRALRRQGLGALRDMLGRLADRRPVAIFLDDVQHGGPDSAALLEVLLTPPDQPPVLVLACSRRPDGGPLVDAVARLAGEHQLPIEPLPPAEARVLAGHLLRVAPDHPRAAALAAEAGGHPFLLAELAVQPDDRPPTTGEMPSLAQAIRGRVALLPEAARRVLALLALAGRPTPAPRLLRAAGLEGRGQAELALLRGARLVQGGIDPATPVAVVHDSIAEAVADGLPTAQRPDLHRALATVLEESDPPDFEALTQHWAAAGDAPRAAGWALRGGAAAVAATAFQQGVFFFRRALELGAPGPEPGRALAQALTYAGRPSEAARAWRALADGAAGELRRVALRRAAEQHLIAGEFAPGRALIDGLLADGGVRRPRSRLRLALLVGGQMLRAWWRGLRGAPGPVGGHEAVGSGEAFDLHLAELNGWSDMAPLDVLWTLARAYRAGMASGDVKRIGVSFAIGHLLVGLSPLPAGRGSATRLLTAARRLAGRDPARLALIEMTETLVCARHADWQAGLDAVERLDAALEGVPTEHGWELTATRAMFCFTCNITGRYALLASRAEEWLADARRRQARTEEAVLLHAGLLMAWLAIGRIGDAHRELDRFAGDFDRAASTFVSALHISGRCRLLRYEGAIAEALSHAREALAWFHAARHTRIDWQVNFMALEAGNVALAALSVDPPPEPTASTLALLDEATALLGRSAWRSVWSWSRAMVAARLAHAGRLDAARRTLDEARRGFEAGVPPPRVAPVLDYVDGHWHGGEEGAALVEQARETMRGQGVVDPDRWARLLFAAPLTPGRRIDR